jgi:3-dehydro-4-phosphotetronate decarboxylase
MQEHQLRDQICELGRSIFDRGLTHGSTGNISVRCEEGWLLTPTGSSLGRLDPARLSKLDWNGKHLSGDPPSKENFLHLAMYQERPRNQAVIHLHSTHSVAISTLEGLDPDNLLPPLTAYYVMRIGTLPLVPYYAPGDLTLAAAVRSYAGRHHAMLLANHGPVVAGASLSAAADAIEELEATAKLYLLVHGQHVRPLTPAQVAQVKRRYPPS